ncbi:hypothetical protein FHR47_002316 [Xanthomonas arboricola]|uniref:hypothetical protein n=1 Tax=Xanthomonas cannabis TaxID=1885674 RepID=UPI00160A3E1C|nr:hypothetical protein [Xanthomonas cannabis]MBB3802068.1 hypothetical protein [Xanthomonas cannabis]
MTKIKRFDQLPRVNKIPEAGTVGAIVGRDLRWPDGSLVQEAQIRQPAAGGSRGNSAATLWRLVREIPLNIQRLAVLASVGFTTRDSDGNWFQRSIGEGTGIDVQNGDGVAGNPTISLEDLPDSGTGAALRKITRDSKGRLAGTSAASTTDLPEGDNQYFTNQRADARADGRIAAQKGQPSGLATLGADSKIPSAQLPAIAITEAFVVGSQAAQLALTAQEGDVAIRTDLSKSYIKNSGTAGTMADWTELLSPSGGSVLSVNSRTGAVAVPDFVSKATAPTAADYGRALINGDRWRNTGNGVLYTRQDGAWLYDNAASLSRYVPARLSNGSASPIPLNADGTIPARLSNGTVSNIPTQA